MIEVKLKVKFLNRSKKCIDQRWENRDRRELHDKSQ